MENEGINFDLGSWKKEDLEKAAKDIFDKESKDFSSLKSRFWYQKILNTITLGAGSQKRTLKAITDIGALQRVFMKAVVENQDTLNKDFGSVLNMIRTIAKAQYNHYSGIKEQKELKVLLEEEASKLLFILKETVNNDTELPDTIIENIRRYNRGIRNVFENTPEIVWNNYPDGIGAIKHPDIFYRCLVEQYICAHGIPCDSDRVSFSPIISTAIKYLELSTERKERIKKAVICDAKGYGVEWFYDKYNKDKSDDLNWEYGLEFDDPDNAEIVCTPIVDPIKELRKLIKEKIDKNGLGEAQLEKIMKGTKIEKILNSALELVGKGASTDTQRDKAEQDQIKYQKRNEVIHTFISAWPDTVIEILKNDDSTLIFTTAAFYYLTKNGKERFAYKDLTEADLSIHTNSCGKCFAIKQSNGKIVNIEGKNLDADQLIDLFRKILTEKVYEETDQVLDFHDLPIETQKLHVGVVYTMLKRCNYAEQEAFRVAADLGVSQFWKEIVKDAEDIWQYDVGDIVQAWRDSIPYPNEAPLNIRLFQDIVRSFQYTRNDEGLSSPELDIVSLLLHKGEVARRDSDMAYARLGKRVIEERVSAEEAEKIMEQFSLSVQERGIFGKSISILGTFAIARGIGLLIPTMGWAWLGYDMTTRMLKTKPEEKRKKEVRRKLYEDIILSYKNAEQLAPTEVIRKALENEREYLEKRTGLKGTCFPISSKLKKAICNWAFEYLATENKNTFGERISEEERSKMLAQVAVIPTNDSPEDILGLCEVSLVDSVTKNIQDCY